MKPAGYGELRHRLARGPVESAPLAPLRQSRSARRQSCRAYAAAAGAVAAAKRGPAMTHSRRQLSATVAAASGFAIILVGCGTLGPSAAPAGPVTATTPVGPATTPSLTATAASPRPGPAGCSTSELTATLGPASVAAGSTFYPIVFTNTSGSAC